MPDSPTVSVSFQALFRGVVVTLCVQILAFLLYRHPILTEVWVTDPQSGSLGNISTFSWKHRGASRPPGPRHVDGQSESSRQAPPQKVREAATPGPVEAPRPPWLSLPQEGPPVPWGLRLGVWSGCSAPQPGVSHAASSQFRSWLYLQGPETSGHRDPQWPADWAEPSPSEMP